MADDAAAQLDQLYKPPHQFTVAKCLDFIDPHGRRFIRLPSRVCQPEVRADRDPGAARTGYSAAFD